MARKEQLLSSLEKALQAEQAFVSGLSEEERAAVGTYEVVLKVTSRSRQTFRHEVNHGYQDQGTTGFAQCLIIFTQPT